MPEIVTSPVRTVSDVQLWQLRELGAEAAAVLSAMPEHQALKVRADMASAITALRLSPRLAGLPADNVVGPEVRRIAERVAAILRLTPTAEHSVIWATFGAASRQHAEMIAFSTEWSCAWMGLGT